MSFEPNGSTALRAVRLDDKYALKEGVAYMTGVQALVRLPLLQRARDQAAGLRTAGFISGYRGSPLGTYDDALHKAKKHLAASDIHFVAGVNEDIAATSVWGTQQAALLPEATVQGVFGIWYGKGPGVDRTADVFKHANAAGTSPFGGVVAIMGDDHGCQSSTLPHQSEQIMAAAMIPVLNPSDVQEHIDFGLMGFALSRFSGCWVGLKATTEVVESSAVVDVSPDRIQIRIPNDYTAPAGGLGIRWPDTPLDMEARLHGPRMDAVQAFARANEIDKPVWRPERASLAIVTTGKSYVDVRQALADLGIDEERAAELGIALYKVGMSWPLEPTRLLAFTERATEILVVEEKRSLIEEQLAGFLINRAERPRLVGKRDEAGVRLLPSAGEIEPLMVAEVIVGRLARLGVDVALFQNRIAMIAALDGIGATKSKLARTPFFCSGCPHNSSTNVPEGSRAMAGIGCHGMAYSIPERRTSFITQMGGEGATWIGQAPFTSEQHVFQNLGDGTYFHSGLLAIRAAGAAGVNITYKILFNDAVAMTGGQPHDGPLSVPLITRQVAAEGAARIVVVTDEPERYEGAVGLAPGVTVHHRDDLDLVQREMREVKGLSIMIYDQTCAAEKRRRRKRGLYPDPPKRVFINDLVCEGCGDCSVKSNCISVKPLETDLGRKRQIDQSDCNKDFSCLKGFCPSFVTVHGGKPKRRAAAKAGGYLLVDVPDPVIADLAAPYNILITGIGGTGVITVGALLGMAAHLEGKGVTALDFTGLAQKNGGVSSHIRLGPNQASLDAVRIGVGSTDLLLACDLVVAASGASLTRLDPDRSVAVVNSRVTPTSAFVRDTMMDLSSAIDRKVLKARVSPDSAFIDATGLATTLMGDSIASNLFMLGFAWQRGLIPLSFAAIDRAIELNGVGVEGNRQSFAWGRLAAHDLAAVERAAAAGGDTPELVDGGVAALIDRRSADLVDYQNAAYAERYRALVALADRAETAVSGEAGPFTEAVARYFYKLMAYKDEYEVARLYTDGRFAAKIADTFEGDFKLEFNLAPPLFSKKDPVTGELRKRTYGPWMMGAFRMLARMRGLRGTMFDPFGYLAERKAERAMVDAYEAEIRALSSTLTAANLADHVALASLPDRIRGYGHVKDRNIEAAQDEHAALLAREKADLPELVAAE
ncbi:indolepyruvate ferredoxin oxidoreductase family protein [uncultured Sphingobium sp.]|uniref:indolepyruvate ferredoxin oxidoreductase family protein n=1 Tax=uncultured Sphingobium sp. TaxID=316087 RepID=UPI00259B0607|nr:indolepyruvate ferredoxin oxidoreductase family protein [uncultured Sphingobium sp.]